MNYNLKKPSFEILVLNGIAILLYLIFVFTVTKGYNSDLIFYSHDSHGYKAVGNWILTGTESSHTEIRPFLYPLYVGLSLKIGAWVIGLTQAIMWLISINLTFLSAQLISTNRFLKWFATTIVLLNFSLLGMTFHALTEVSTAFLLSILVYTTLKNRQRLHEFYFLNRFVLLFVLLALLRPLFYPFLLLVLAIIVVIKAKSYLKQPKQIFYLFILLTPIFFQLSIMKSKHDTFQFSKIGPNTLKYFLVAKVHQDLDHITREESVKLVSTTSAEEDKKFLLNNLTETIKVFFENVWRNTKTTSSYSRDLLNDKDTVYFNLMTTLNKGFLFIHLLFLVINSSLFLYYLLNKRSELLAFIILSGMSYGIILSSGVSFYQGDRLILPSIVIWPILYLMSTVKIIQLIQNKKIKGS